MYASCIEKAENKYNLIITLNNLRGKQKYGKCSEYEKLQATRAKVAPVNLIYGSHFSATEATFIVSQNMENFVEFTRTFTRITHKPVPV